MTAVMWWDNGTLGEGQAAGDETPVGEVCYENIGPRERALRARFGAQALIFGVVLGISLVLLGADRWWRLVLFFPLAVAVTNWLQARERT